MANRLIAKAIFLALVIAVSFGAALLYFRFSASKQAGGAPEPSQTPQPAAASQDCIITIDGSKYDVTTLRSTHTGGDVFQCGTDMSAVFHGQHGNNLRLIQKYLVK